MRLEELQMENEYQLRLKDMNYNEKMKELSDKFTQQIESLKSHQQVCWSPTRELHSKYAQAHLTVYSQNVFQKPNMSISFYVSISCIKVKLHQNATEALFVIEYESNLRVKA